MTQKKKAIHKLGEKLIKLGEKLANVKCFAVFYDGGSKPNCLK